MDRIEFELFGSFVHALQMNFVGREALEGLQPPRKIVGVDEVGEMAASCS